MSVKIFLVRHGQDHDNLQGVMNGRRDSSLTMLGREQAGLARDRVVNEKIGAIYSSSLQRAKETAEIIAKPHGLIVQTDERLLERDFGIYTGKPTSELIQYSKNYIATADNFYVLDGKGTERFAEVYKRAKSFVTDLIKNHQQEQVVIVCHNDIAKMIQAVIWHREIEDVLKNTPFLANGSVNELTIED